MSSLDRLAMIRSLAKSRGMLPARPVMLAKSVPSVHVWKSAPAPVTEPELPEWLQTLLANLAPLAKEFASALALPAPGESSVSRPA